MLAPDDLLGFTPVFELVVLESVDHGNLMDPICPDLMTIGTRKPVMRSSSISSDVLRIDRKYKTALVNEMRNMSGMSLCKSPHPDGLVRTCCPVRLVDLIKALNSIGCKTVRFSAYRILDIKPRTAVNSSSPEHPQAGLQ
ncbi:unnamed protein product [Tilletia controversa]|nr:hypothetical protein CF336_g8647 [Tilletia laevis]KAE8189060.1 hypothetical protein CF328_g6400 [Tilletia controversa]CAD6939751.1 unnamed protein product [Tilletia controversa]CAD6947382.1 unnamed protein product [Tilletia controversa]CAD6970585.1 unnamed protein product [Tilletia controversa]